MTAIKYDIEKPRMDLLDPEFLEGVAKVLTFGARKYSPYNWRNGFDYSRIISSLYRHLTAFQRGEDRDPESGESHLYHIGCNAMFLAAIQKEHPELDDRYKGKQNVHTSSDNLIYPSITPNPTDAGMAKSPRASLDQRGSIRNARGVYGASALCGGGIREQHLSGVFPADANETLHLKAQGTLFD